MSKVSKQELTAILGELRKSGHRITKARSTIIEILATSDKPLTAAQILANQHIQEISKEKTTIYRELEFLVSEGLAITVDLNDGRRRFELSTHEDHHHHLVCTRCEAVTCVTLPQHLSEIERALEKKHKFVITSHTLEFFGLCNDCRKE